MLLFRHELGNRLLTFLCNLVTNLNLTDMETCYKAVRTALLQSIPIVSHDFRLEPELTIKLAKRQARLFEVPISYSGRDLRGGQEDQLARRVSRRRHRPVCLVRQRQEDVRGRLTYRASAPVARIDVRD